MINGFLAQLKNGVRPNRFEVVFTFPSYAGGSDESRSSPYLVTAASMPTMNMGVIEQRFKGRTLKIPGDRTFDEWSCTVLNDGGMTLYEAFKKWHNGINSFDSNIMPNIEDMYSQVEIHQLNTKDERIMSETLKLAWPSVVGAIELSHESGDALSTFEVTWQYSAIDNGENT